MGVGFSFGKNASVRGNQYEEVIPGRQLRVRVKLGLTAGASLAIRLID